MGAVEEARWRRVVVAVARCAARGAARGRRELVLCCRAVVDTDALVAGEGEARDAARRPKADVVARLAASTAWPGVGGEVEDGRDWLCVLAGTLACDRRAPGGLDACLDACLALSSALGTHWFWSELAGDAFGGEESSLARSAALLRLLSDEAAARLELVSAALRAERAWSPSPALAAALASWTDECSSSRACCADFLRTALPELCQSGGATPELMQAAWRGSREVGNPFATLVAVVAAATAARSKVLCIALAADPAAWAIVRTALTGPLDSRQHKQGLFLLRHLLAALGIEPDAHPLVKDKYPAPPRKQQQQQQQQQEEVPKRKPPVGHAWLLVLQLLEALQPCEPSVRDAAWRECLPALIGAAGASPGDGLGASLARSGLPPVPLERSWVDLVLKAALASEPALAVRIACEALATPHLLSHERFLLQIASLEVWPALCDAGIAVGSDDLSARTARWLSEQRPQSAELGLSVLTTALELLARGQLRAFGRLVEAVLVLDASLGDSGSEALPRVDGEWLLAAVVARFARCAALARNDVCLAAQLPAAVARARNALVRCVGLVGRPGLAVAAVARASGFEASDEATRAQLLEWLGTDAESLGRELEACLLAGPQEAGHRCSDAAAEWAEDLSVLWLLLSGAAAAAGAAERPDTAALLAWCRVWAEPRARDPARQDALARCLGACCALAAAAPEAAPADAVRRLLAAQPHLVAELERWATGSVLRAGSSATPPEAAASLWGGLALCAGLLPDDAARAVRAGAASVACSMCSSVTALGPLERILLPALGVQATAGLLSQAQVSAAPLPTRLALLARGGAALPGEARKAGLRTALAALAAISADTQEPDSARRALLAAAACVDHELAAELLTALEPWIERCLLQDGALLLGDCASASCAALARAVAASAISGATLRGAPEAAQRLCARLLSTPALRVAAADALLFAAVPRVADEPASRWAPLVASLLLEGAGAELASPPCATRFLALRAVECRAVPPGWLLALLERVLPHVRGVGAGQGPALQALCALCQRIVAEPDEEPGAPPAPQLAALLEALLGGPFGTLKGQQLHRYYLELAVAVLVARWPREGLALLLSRLKTNALDVEAEMSLIYIAGTVANGLQPAAELGGARGEAAVALRAQVAHALFPLQGAASIQGREVAQWALLRLLTLDDEGRQQGLWPALVQGSRAYATACSGVARQIPRMSARMARHDSDAAGNNALAYFRALLPELEAAPASADARDKLLAWVSRALAGDGNLLGRLDEEALDALMRGRVRVEVAASAAALRISASGHECNSATVLAPLVTKATNQGGLARTCEALGTRDLALCPLKGADLRAFRDCALGADRWLAQRLRALPLSDTSAELVRLRAAGYRVVALEQSSQSVRLERYRFPRDGKVAFLLGAEKQGVPTHLLNLCEDCIEIPQLGQTRSLNVHASCAILLWEYVKQHEENLPATTATATE